MNFSDEPTARGDQIAGYVRDWYEKNRETWRDRFWRWRHQDAADEFMLRLVGEVCRVVAEAERQKRVL